MGKKLCYECFGIFYNRSMKCKCCEKNLCSDCLIDNMCKDCYVETYNIEMEEEADILKWRFSIKL